MKTSPAYEAMPQHPVPVHDEPAPEVGAPPTDPDTAPDESADAAAPARGGLGTVWRNRLRSVALLGLAVAGLGALALQGEEAADAPSGDASPDLTQTIAPPRIDVGVAQQQDLDITVQATGRLRAARRVYVSPTTSGIVTKRSVREGQAVRKGQVLFVLDTRALRLELQDALASRREAAAAVDEARASLAEADLDAALSRRERRIVAPDSTGIRDAQDLVDRVRRRHRDGTASSAEVARAERSLNEARLFSGHRADEVTQVRSGQARAQAAIARAQSVVARHDQAVARARLDIAAATVRAPFSGRVSHLAVEPGQYVSPGEELVELVDTHRLSVDIEMPEAAFAQVRAGQSARVAVPSVSPDPVSGRVSAVVPDVDAETGVGRVLVDIRSGGRRFVPGLYARGSIVVDRVRDRVTVPSEAVIERESRSVVFVARGGQAHWVYVETGAESAGRTEIVSGVAVGDTVAVDGHFALAHGAAIRTGQVIDGTQP